MVSRRRTLLGLLGASGSLTAGCINRANSGEPGNQSDMNATTPYWEDGEEVTADADGRFIRPASEPDTVPSKLDCPEEAVTEKCEEVREAYDMDIDCDDSSARRLRQRPDEDKVQWGGDPDSGWVLQADRSSLQHGEEVTIYLEGSDRRGSNSRFNLQVFTEAGWEDVRVTTDWLGDDHEDIQLGGDEEWTFDFGDDLQFTHTRMSEMRTLFACPGTPNGRYRFVYWGIGDPADGLAVAFDLTD